MRYYKYALIGLLCYCQLSFGYDSHYHVDYTWPKEYSFEITKTSGNTYSYENSIAFPISIINTTGYETAITFQSTGIGNLFRDDSKNDANVIAKSACPPFEYKAEKYTSSSGSNIKFTMESGNKTINVSQYASNIWNVSFDTDSSILFNLKAEINCYYEISNVAVSSIEVSNTNAINCNNPVTNKDDIPCVPFPIMTVHVTDESISSGWENGSYHGDDSGDITQWDYVFMPSGVLGIYNTIDAVDLSKVESVNSTFEATYGNTPGGKDFIAYFFSEDKMLSDNGGSVDTDNKMQYVVVTEKDSSEDDIKRDISQYGFTRSSNKNSTYRNPYDFTFYNHTNNEVEVQYSISSTNDCVNTDHTSASISKPSSFKVDSASTETFTLTLSSACDGQIGKQLVGSVDIDAFLYEDGKKSSQMGHAFFDIYAEYSHDGYLNDQYIAIEDNTDSYTYEVLNTKYTSSFAFKLIGYRFQYGARIYSDDKAGKKIPLYLELNSSQFFNCPTIPTLTN